MSGQVTKRSPGFVGARRRAVGFVEYASGVGTGETGTSFRVPAKASALDFLTAVPAVADRLYLLDAPPEAWGGWARAAALPMGWTHAPRGHHLPRDSSTTPSLRFTRPDGRELELRNGAEWFGAEGVRLGSWACASAWALLGRELAQLPQGGELLASPSGTGRDLLARTLPRGHEFPVLDADTRELIRSTAPQGRVELLPPATKTLGGLVELDARTAYGACLRGLGSGPVTHDTLPELPLDERGRLSARCRLKVRVTVPEGWAHVGLLGAPTRPYTYPRTPGETFTTWADGWEVQTALDHGWRVEVLERLLFTASAPLDQWRKVLVALVSRLEAAREGDGTTPAIGGALAGRAVRNMLVSTVGAFAQTGYRVTRTATNPEDVPAGVAFVQDEAGGFVWEERRELSGLAATFSHPEWAAQVWSRARVRLLSTPVTKAYPTPTGALHVPFAHVVALRTDALYLTAAPGWPDDGEWGRYRLKGALLKRRAWPTTATELLKLRDAGRVELAGLRG